MLSIEESNSSRNDPIAANEKKKLNILVFDYDGTLTLENGPLMDSTIFALRQVHDRKLSLLGVVSGRDLAFLEKINERIRGLFSFLVAENGAVIHFFDSNQTSIIGKEWTERARAVLSDAPFPVQFSQIIGSSRRENMEKIAELVKRKNLDCKLVPNKNSVMICPPDVDKGTGVALAIDHYRTTANVLLTCFGDGENDVELFGPADISVAVSNSVPALKKIADVVTRGEGGFGVEEYLRRNLLKEIEG